MKRFLLILFIFATSFTFAQTYELDKSGDIKLDSTLTTIVNDIYYDEMYSDSNNIEYYNKRLKDVMFKYYFVKDNSEAIEVQNWISTSFKPALDNAIKQRQEFINKQNN